MPRKSPRNTRLLSVALRPILPHSCPPRQLGLRWLRTYHFHPHRYRSHSPDSPDMSQSGVSQSLSTNLAR